MNRILFKDGEIEWFEGVPNYFEFRVNGRIAMHTIRKPPDWIVPEILAALKAAEEHGAREAKEKIRAAIGIEVGE